MKTVALCSIAFLLLATCKKKDDSTTDAQLRIWNVTAGTIFNCEVNPGSTTYNYERVGIDSFSAYHVFPKVYSYGYINLMINNKMYRIQPIDYVGETPLANGRYTYKLTLSSTDRLEMTLIKE